VRTRPFMVVDDAEIAAYVDAAAHVQGMPLTAEYRDGVIAATARLAAFAADVAGVELSGDIEVAGVFVP
jgi:hypothetical protein